MHIPGKRSKKLLKKWFKKGDVAKKDASAFVSDLTAKGEMERKELKKIIGEEIKGAIEAVQPISKEDIRQIIREEMGKSEETGK